MVRQRFKYRVEILSLSVKQTLHCHCPYLSLLSYPDKLFLSSLSNIYFEFYKDELCFFSRVVDARHILLKICCLYFPCSGGGREREGGGGECLCWSDVTEQLGSQSFRPSCKR